jgi:heme exporter protein B
MPWLLFKRDLMLAFRRGGGAWATLSFCLIVFSVFAISLGPEQLAANASRVLTVTVLLSCLLALPGLFERDFEDGTLEQYLLRADAMEWLVLSKLAAFWLTAAAPLVLASPLLGLMAGLQPEALPGLAGALLLATPTLVAIGALGAALTLGLRKGGVAQTLILLPLYVPALIFTVSIGENESAPLLLTGMLLASLPLSCFASAWLLRLLYD